MKNRHRAKDSKKAMRGTAVFGQWRLKRVRASYTVEAAVLMPLILFIIVKIIDMGFEGYQSTTDIAAQVTEQADTEPAKRVRKLLFLDNVLEVEQD